MPDGTDTVDGSIAAYLEEHPRAAGALFALLLVLSQAGSVAAGTNPTWGP